MTFFVPFSSNSHEEYDRLGRIYIHDPWSIGMIYGSQGIWMGFDPKYCFIHKIESNSALFHLIEWCIQNVSGSIVKIEPSKICFFFNLINKFNSSEILWQFTGRKDDRVWWNEGEKFKFKNGHKMHLIHQLLYVSMNFMNVKQH